MQESCSHRNHYAIFTMRFQCFLTSFSQNFATVRVDLEIYGVVMVRANMIAPTTRGMGFPSLIHLLCCLIPVLFRQWRSTVLNIVSLHLWYPADSSTNTVLPNPSRETKFSGVNEDTEKFVFPVQLTTSRIVNFYRLIVTLVICDDHTYIHMHGKWNMKVQQKSIPCF